MYFVERKRNMPNRINERAKRRRPWPWLAVKRESRSFQSLTALWVWRIPFRGDDHDPPTAVILQSPGAARLPLFFA